MAYHNQLGQINLPKFFSRLFTPPAVLRQAAVDPAQRTRLLNIARAAWPDQAAKIEAQLSEQIKSVIGERAQERVTEAVQNPVTWLMIGGMGLVLVWSVMGRRR